MAQAATGPYQPAPKVGEAALDLYLGRHYPSRLST